MHSKRNPLPLAGKIIILAVVLMISLLISVGLGRYPISISEMFGIFTSKMIAIEPYWQPVQESLLLFHRLPRILLACLVGCCLATAGAAYQGIFQNPMASPDLLGASSGAAFGAALAILLHMNSTLIMLFAFVGGLLTVLLVVFIGNRAKGKRVLGIVLAGIMVSSLVSSGTSFIKLAADPEDELPAITYWLMGSLNGTEPADVRFALPFMLAGMLPLILLRWKMNLLTLGENEARTLGINARRIKFIVVLCSTLVTAASVAVSGVIGWVGLAVPHFCRRLVGSNYRYLIPASMLSGAVFLLLTDDLSRNLLATEIPIGILTSFIGAPFFIYLLTRDGDRT